MKYTAVMDIDDDRWCKHPFAITVYDDKGEIVEHKNFLDDRNECYRITDKYGIRHEDVVEDIG